MSEKERLFEKFNAVTTAEWMDKIMSDLKGEDFEKKLVWKTREGFTLKPFYRKEDIAGLPFINANPGESPFVRGTGKDGNRWKVRQNIGVTDYSDSNKKALDILMKGVDSLGFVIKEPGSINPANIEKLLEGIHPESLEINFISEGRAKEMLDAFLRFLDKTQTSPGLVKGAIEADPLGRLMLNGKLCISFGAGLDYLASLTQLSLPLSGFRTVQVNASNFSNAGAGIVTELAFGLAMGNEYMSILTDRDIPAEMAASKIRFSFGIGSNYFFEIAKLRAARLLWSLIAGAYMPGKTEDTRMEIHCVTTAWNKTIYDPYINLLRTQTETMSAVLGGTDSLTVEPFDMIFGSPDEFSERIARNQQLLLKEEAYFDKVADPAGGSYYIEMLTSHIAAGAWKLFLETEETGGFTGALRKGFIQKRISDSARERFRDISERKEILVGTNQYPGINEKIIPEVNKTEEISPDSATDEKPLEPVRLSRAAEQIEKLRSAAGRAPERPVAFMLTIGNPVMRKARSQFSCNFFACGGYRVIDNYGFTEAGEGVKAALEAKADIVVICSSDEEYGEIAPVVFEKIGGKAVVVVAGNPACRDDLKKKGIEHFINIRSGLVETLTVFHKLTGVI